MTPRIEDASHRPGASHSAGAPWVAPRDFAFSAYLAAWTAVAWTVPEHHWERLCIALARLTTRARSERTAKQVRNVERVLAGRRRGRDARTIVERYVANQHHERLIYLRSHRTRGWRPRLRLVGSEHVERALAAGRGGILWVHPLVFRTLVTKMALGDAGFEVSHLSRFEHGISHTRLGARILNPIWTAAEERHLAERLVMQRGRSVGALREIATRVRHNRLVSIAAGHQGKRTQEVPMLGGTIELAEGPAALALKSGAALLPVFTILEDDGALVTTVEPPLEIPQGLERRDAVGRLLREFARRLEPCVLGWPEQYAGWDA